MEGRLPRAEGRGPQCLGRAPHSKTLAMVVQPALRPAGAGPARGGRLCPLVRRACLPAAAGPEARRPAPSELPRVPAAAAPRLLLGGAGARDAAPSAIQQLTGARHEVVGCNVPEPRARCVAVAC